MAYIDFSKLPSQNAKSYSALSYENIMPLYDYHPWDRSENPNIDQITNTLINLKKDKTPPIKFFTKVIRSQFLGLMPSTPKSFCIVPSHTKDHVSEAMMTIMNNLKAEFYFSNNSNLLNRTSTVPKAATGGDRSIQHHLDSIEVINNEHIQGKEVFLIDDISTTGNSMQACKKILLEAGAKKVVMISLGQTFSKVG